MQMNAGNPQVTAMLRAQAQRMGVDLGGTQAQIEGEQPIAIPAGQNELRGIEAVALAEGAKPEVADQADPWAKPNTDQLDYAKILAAQGIDPRDQKNWGGYDSWLTKNNRNKATTVSVDGRSDLTKGMTEDLQKKATNARKALAQIDKLKGFGEEFFGVGARLRQAGISIKDVASGVLGNVTPDQKQYLQGRVALVGRGQALLAKVLNSVSGATVSEQERESWRQIVGDPESAGYERYQALLENFKSMLEEDVAIEKDTLANGVDTSRDPVPVTRGGKTRLWDPVKKVWIK
jgi:hypothetical protein